MLQYSCADTSWGLLTKGIVWLKNTRSWEDTGTESEALYQVEYLFYPGSSEQDGMFSASASLEHREARESGYY